MELTDEISEAISQPHFSTGIDEAELQKELEELEQEKLETSLVNAGGVPVTIPGGADKVHST
jgi:charged multivesicular body protein 4A/B